MRFLITAGPTREYLDPVRYLSNASSGRMGFALAEAARDAGHDVTVLHGPVELVPPNGVCVVAVVSAAEMLEAARREWPTCDVLIMAAAVADYTPAEPSAKKLKKSPAPLALRLVPTVDILRELATARRGDQVVIGFALESEDGRANAERKLRDKRLDLVVLNAPATIGSGSASVELLTAGGAWERIPAGDKGRVAGEIVARAARIAAQRAAK